MSDAFQEHLARIEAEAIAEAEAAGKTETTTEDGSPGFPYWAALKGARVSAIAHAESAMAFYAPLIPLVLELRRQGMSLRDIGRELDDRGIRPRRNPWTGEWSVASVRRILCRALGKPVDVRTPKPPREIEPPKPPPKVEPKEEEPAYIRLVLNGMTSEAVLTKSQVKKMLDTRHIGPNTMYFFPGMTAPRPVSALFEQPQVKNELTAKGKG